ncbi:hypothetical protein COU61_01605 [Candidatus Pacearchaeota archaeon CG10_big_fil_rev_8_21_14_0_10_35_13]|nr:MAG: hypothetical protein COU61_01605 [Candidatus Pacearchaeota archaeon CG10_big_fil_rev_8_21_14_0_10_35_13]
MEEKEKKKIKKGLGINEEELKALMLISQGVRTLETFYYRTLKPKGRIKELLLGLREKELINLNTTEVGGTMVGEEHWDAEIVKEVFSTFS